MAHLVFPIDIQIPVSEALPKIRAAHTYLVKHGVRALAAHATENLAYWGTHVKRIHVHFPKGDRPELIDPDIESHNLTEVYNQCATMERLIDGLQWAQIALPDYEVLLCHPTTSSVQESKSKTPDHGMSSLEDGKPQIPDHDLVLINARDQLACFEVSDVVNKLVDSNRKEKKDLTSLGVLPRADAPVAHQWPKARVFLIVSKEFADILKKRGTGFSKQKPSYFYQPCFKNEQTSIFEVLPALSS